MAINRSNVESSRRGLVDRLFLQHPHSLGMSWAKHAGGAVKIGFQLIGAGFAALVHGAVPGWFTETAGRRVTETYHHIQKNRAASSTPDNWSDYDI
ncbi:MAG: DUF6356 family protein [Sphingomonas sp.]